MSNLGFGKAFPAWALGCAREHVWLGFSINAYQFARPTRTHSDASLSRASELSNTHFWGCAQWAVASLPCCLSFPGGDQGRLSRGNCNCSSVGFCSVCPTNKPLCSWVLQCCTQLKPYYCSCLNGPTLQHLAGVCLSEGHTFLYMCTEVESQDSHPTSYSPITLKNVLVCYDWILLIALF